MVTKITDNNMSAALSSPIAVVDFSATWCMPCRMLAPVLDEISEEMGDVAFFNADTDENPVLSAQNKIRNIPAVLIFKNGTLADSVIGFLPKEQLKDRIEACCKDA